MPKSRKRSSSSEYDYESIAKRLKRIENELKYKQANGRRRRRIVPIVESSSSSRDSTPSPEYLQGGVCTDSQNVEDTQFVRSASVQEDPRDVAMAEIMDGDAPVVVTQSSIDNTVCALEEGLDIAVLEILGDDPTVTVEYGKEIHKELANRFEHIATAGLTKEARKELCEKYLVPSNCTRIGAPKLNSEIKATLNESLVKRDKAIESRQKQIASAISCLTQVASEQLQSKNHVVLRQVMDAARLLCDVQYSESVTRRNFATCSLKKDMKDHLYNAKIDTFLFGESLTDAIKTAKAVTKSGTELKMDNKPKVRQTARNTSFKNLNWKSPAPAGRQAEPPRSREPAPRRRSRVPPSKQSSQPTRPRRR